ncbi:hypothetical protein PVAP13_9KG079040 [Panicum virgatum]|uniref:Uncharacterized protein n=1 Tax=Panicum virgatum TaxID=38727 RepID=A0A8T0NGR1_PANVG|nr:hypothetical protein PVAP13_9KG079040 [Panicum virgatum]
MAGAWGWGWRGDWWLSSLLRRPRFRMTSSSQPSHPNRVRYFAHCSSSERLITSAASWVEFYSSEVFTPCCGVKSRKVRLTMSEMIQRKMGIRNLQRIARKSKSRLQQRSGNQHR